MSWSLPSRSLSCSCRSHSLKFRKLHTKYLSVAHFISLSLALLNNYLTNKSKSFYFLKLFLAWGFWFRLNQIFCSLSRSTKFSLVTLSNLPLSFSHTLTKGKRSRRRRRLFGLFAFDTNQQQEIKKKLFFFLFRLFYTTFLLLSLSFAYYISTCFRFTEIWDELSLSVVCVCVIFFLFLAHVCMCEWMNVIFLVCVDWWLFSDCSRTAHTF